MSNLERKLKGIEFDFDEDGSLKETFASAVSKLYGEKVPDDFVSVVRELYNYITSELNRTIGTPLSRLAACSYFSGIDCGYKRTQTEIAEAFGSTRSTVQSTYKKIISKIRG